MSIDRLYANYDNNTNVITKEQGKQWIRFPDASQPTVAYRANNFSINSGGNQITYTGGSAIPKWTRMDAVVELNTTKWDCTLQMQWRLNGAPSGPIRTVYLASNTMAVVSGFGELPLKQGDVIEPWIHSDTLTEILIKNFSVIVREDND